MSFADLQLRLLLAEAALPPVFSMVTSLRGEEEEGEEAEGEGERGWPSGGEGLGEGGGRVREDGEGARGVDKEALRAIREPFLNEVRGDGGCTGRRPSPEERSGSAGAQRGMGPGEGLPFGCGEMTKEGLDGRARHAVPLRKQAEVCVGNNLRQQSEGSTFDCWASQLSCLLQL